MRLDRRAPKRAWTAEDISTAAEIYKRTISALGNGRGSRARAAQAVATALDRPLSTIESRVQTFGTSFGHARAAAETPNGGSIRAPDGVLAERDRRREAEDRRDVPAAFFGDPPPGYSALDQRRS